MVTSNQKKRKLIMKIKTLSLIAAAFALSLTAIPFTAEAQQTSPTRQAGKEFGKRGPWKQLGLTDEQKTKMREIRRNARAEMKKVLTPAQQETLKAAMQQRRNQGLQGKGKREWRKQVFNSLNLTNTQKNQMRAIKESTKQQMKAVLTPGQLEQLQQMRQNRQLRRQQGNFQ